MTTSASVWVCENSCPERLCFSVASRNTALGRGPGRFTRRRLVRFLCRDPRPHTRIEYVEWQGALTQHLIVERAEVELRAQLPLPIGAQRRDLELRTLC